MGKNTHVLKYNISSVSLTVNRLRMNTCNVKSTNITCNIDHTKVRVMYGYEVYEYEGYIHTANDFVKYHIVNICKYLLKTKNESN